MPDACFFACRAVLSALEVVVIFSFLGFLMDFRPLLRDIRAPGAQRNRFAESIRAAATSPRENSSIQTTKADE